MNNVSLSGFVGKQPVIRNQESGEKVAAFSVAVKSFYTKNNQKQEKTNWIQVVAFGRNAELTEQYILSGKLIGVTGSLNQNSWVDPSGETKTSLEVVADKIDFFSFNKEKEEGENR